MKLTLERARELLAGTTDDPKLLVHATNVRGCMEAFARRFGLPQDEVEHWGAVGFLHDYDYQRFPEEHLAHTESELLAAGVDADDVRAILSHGWGICNDVKPESDLEKSLYCADELSGLVWAAALMRPGGISDLEPKSVVKKFKDKRFAAKCSREVIRRGAELVGLDLADAIAVCIEGMRPFAAETGLLPRASTAAAPVPGHE
jgi:predicted hydrolase (HD superfamily)